MGNVFSEKQYLVLSTDCRKWVVFFLFFFLFFFFFSLHDDDVGLHVLGCRVDILGTNCNFKFDLQSGCGNL